jgi:hypothetical protein
MKTQKVTLGALIPSVYAKTIPPGTGAARARAETAQARTDMRGNALSWRATGDAAQLRLAVMARDTAWQFEIGAVLLSIGEQAGKVQARRIHELRGGAAPSATSRDDAAADAVASVVSHVRRLDKLTLRQWQSARLLRVLRLFAARGAFLSLATWAGGGLTGDNTAAERFNGALVESLTVDLARHLASGGDQAEPFEHDTAARRGVVRWVFRVGLYDFARGLPADMQAGARAHTLTQARRRCRVLGSVILGATFDEATCNAGFASLKSFAQSCKDAKLFEALREARAAAIENSGAVELARVGAARWRIAAGAAWRTLARLPSALEFTGTASGRNVTHPIPKRRRGYWRGVMRSRHSIRLSQCVITGARSSNARRWLTFTPLTWCSLAVSWTCATVARRRGLIRCYTLPGCVIRLGACVAAGSATARQLPRRAARWRASARTLARWRCGSDVAKDFCPAHNWHLHRLANRRTPRHVHRVGFFCVQPRRETGAPFRFLPCPV